MSSVNNADNLEAWVSLVGKDWWDHARELADKLSNQNTAPPRELVFAALYSIHPDRVKVVILGQDPYPTPGRARGVAFGYRSDYQRAPVSSLLNIMTESGATDPTLQSWVDQEVLLLNTRLTVERGKPMSHANLGWEPLINKLLDKLMDRQIVWILLGAEARKTVTSLTKYSKVGVAPIILTTSHPCKFSAHRGFLGSGIFKQANEQLTLWGYTPVDWARKK